MVAIDSSHAFRRTKRVVFAAGLIAILVLLVFFSCRASELTRCISAVAFSPDGSRLAAGMYEGRDAGVFGKRYHADVCRTVEVFPVDTSGPGVVIAQETRWGNQGPLVRMTPAIRFLRHGQQLAVLLNREGRLDVWDLSTLQKVRSELPELEQIVGFAYSTDERVVAVAMGSGISIRSVSSGPELYWIDDASSRFWQAPQLAFSPV